MSSFLLFNQSVKLDNQQNLTQGYHKLCKSLQLDNLFMATSKQSSRYCGVGIMFKQLLSTTEIPYSPSLAISWQSFSTLLLFLSRSRHCLQDSHRNFTHGVRMARSVRSCVSSPLTALNSRLPTNHYKVIQIHYNFDPSVGLFRIPIMCGVRHNAESSYNSEEGAQLSSCYTISSTAGNTNRFNLL